jgi:hypothetical protein
MPIQYGGPGVTPSLGALVTTAIELQGAQAYAIPAGRWNVNLGTKTVFQEFNPITLGYQNIEVGSTSTLGGTVFSDGVNYRLFNPTGTGTGSTISAAGSGYLTPPVVTASSGGSVWRAIVGGAVSSTISITNGGTNYTYPPLVLISPPPGGGIPATAYATLTAGVVSAVTLVAAGAGYAFPPTISFVNDPREGLNGVAQGYNAAATCTLTGSGTVTGLTLIDPGAAVASAAPTLAFTSASGSGAAATVTGWVAAALDAITILPT